jgi:hypothetical protein
MASVARLMFLCEHGSPIDQSAYDLKLKAPAEQKEILFMSGQRFGELQPLTGTAHGIFAKYRRFRAKRMFRGMVPARARKMPRSTARPMTTNIRSLCESLRTISTVLRIAGIVS